MHDKLLLGYNSISININNVNDILNDHAIMWMEINKKFGYPNTVGNLFFCIFVIHLPWHSVEGLNKFVNLQIHWRYENQCVIMEPQCCRLIHPHHYRRHGISNQVCLLGSQALALFWPTCTHKSWEHHSCLHQTHEKMPQPLHYPQWGKLRYLSKQKKYFILYTPPWICLFQWFLWDIFWKTSHKPKVHPRLKVHIFLWVANNRHMLFVILLYFSLPWWLQLFHLVYLPLAHLLKFFSLVGLHWRISVFFWPLWLLLLEGKDSSFIPSFMIFKPESTVQVQVWGRCPSPKSKYFTSIHQLIPNSNWLVHNWNSTLTKSYVYLAFDEAEFLRTLTAFFWTILPESDQWNGSLLSHYWRLNKNWKSEYNN